MRALLVSLFFVVLLSGCVAPVQAVRDLPEPQSLTEVNALLDGKRVDIELADGQMVSDVHSVSLDVQWVRYATGRGPTLESGYVAVETVSQITYVRNRGTRAGAVVGSVPGIGMLGFTGIAAVGVSASDVSGGLLLVAVGGMVSAALLAVGAPLGA